MAVHSQKFNQAFIASGANRIPIGGQDRYFGQDITRDQRYLEGLAGRLMLASYGVDTALLSGGLVVEGSSKALVNISAARGLALFDVEVDDTASAWAIPAPTTTKQIPMLIESSAQTDFSLSGATLDGVTVNYVKLRYKETGVQARLRAMSSGTYNYAVRDDFQITVSAAAPTDNDVVLATLVGDGSTTLTITQKYPVGPAGQQMAECADMGVAYDGDDSYLGERLKIAFGNPLGATIISDAGLTPTAWSSARTSESPTNPEYCPVVKRHDADHDITTTHVPQKVIDHFRAISIVQFTGTVSGSVITFSSDADGFLAAFVQANLVNRWYSSGESATFAASGAHYNYASRQYCINIDGTDYAVTACDTVARTITVSGTPASGSQTVRCYPFRIAGSTTSIRLRRVSGEAAVAAGDATGEVLIALARLDRFHDHGHNFALGGQIGSVAWNATNYPNTTPQGSFYTGDNTQRFTNTVDVLGAIGTGSTGAARVGKTTDPRAYGVGVYTFVRSLLQAV